MAEERDWATKYLLDPFTEPEPSQETGPGTHFRSSYDNPPSEPSPPYEAPGVRSHGTGSSTNPFRKGPNVSKASDTSSVRQISEYGYMTPPTSGSPRRTEFPASVRAGKAPIHDHSHQQLSGAKSPGNTRTRSTSLTERYPGDSSHQPLAIIRKESKKANRSPHLRKKHLPGADTIDRLDLASQGFYHHEGPYDAALRARNASSKMSPLAAVQRGNEETLKATPHENIVDSLKRHRPLDGVAAVPPGATDRFGRKYDYKEGANLMIEGNYRRWPGMEYKDDDIKGKGEPSYSIEKSLQEHKQHGDKGEHAGIELKTHRRHRSLDTNDSMYTDDPERDIRRTHSTKKNADHGLKKRFSLRKRRD